MSRGWVLLEMLAALAMFVMTALAVLGAIDRGLRSAERTRDQARAVDLARSTMTKLEAGLGTVQSLAGPVPAWEPGLEPVDPGAPFDESAAGGFSETPPAPSLWEIEIDTMRSEFPGLTHVTVTAAKRASPDGEAVVASWSLHQLVRLGPEGEDSVGELDEMMQEAMPRGGGR